MKSHHVDLLNEAIAPALTRLALPIMATSLVQMLYNLTDMAWIGRLGAGAVTAVGSAGMYTWFSQGFAILARTGGQVKTAHCLGAEGVFVGSGIFKSGDPRKRAEAIVKAVTNFEDYRMLAELSEDLGEAMVGINEQEIELLMAERGR